MAAATAKYATGFGVSSGTNNAVWVDVATIAAANLTAGKDYLILCGGDIDHADTTTECKVRVIRGSTVLTEVAAWEAVNAADKPMFGFMARDTQPGSAEDIKLQCQPSSTTAHTVDGWLWALKLSDDFTENTDFYWNEVTTDDTTVGTTFESGASVTFTPNGTDDWLVIGHAVLDSNTATASWECGLSMDGTMAPMVRLEGEDATTEHINVLFPWVWTPSAASHTFSVQYRMPTGTAPTIERTNIFAINLSKFSQHSFQTDATEIALSTTPTFTNIAGVDPNPSVTGDWFVFGFAVCDHNSLGEGMNTRLQINASGGGLASNPAYGDDASSTYAPDGTDEMQALLFTQVALTSGAAREINLDATSVTGGATLRAEDRCLVAFSLELAGGAAPASLVWQPPTPTIYI